MISERQRGIRNQTIQEIIIKQSQELITLCALVVERISFRKIVVSDETGNLTISIKQGRSSTLLRAGANLSFHNLKIKQKRVLITFNTTIEKIQEKQSLKNIPIVPEKTITSNDLKQSNINSIIINKLFLKIHTINQPEKCSITEQYLQKIICYDNTNIVTLVLQGSMLIKYISQRLTSCNCCMIQDFIVLEKFELNFTVKLVENISTLSIPSN